MLKNKRNHGMTKATETTITKAEFIKCCGRMMRVHNSFFHSMCLFNFPMENETNGDNLAHNAIQFLFFF